MRAGCGVAQRQSKASLLCGWTSLISPLIQWSTWGTSLVGQLREGGWKGIITSYRIKDRTSGTCVKLSGLPLSIITSRKATERNAHQSLPCTKVSQWQEWLSGTTFWGARVKLSLSHRQLPPQWPLLLLYWRTEASAGVWQRHETKQWPSTRSLEERGIKDVHGCVWCQGTWYHQTSDLRSVDYSCFRDLILFLSPSLSGSAPQILPPTPPPDIALNFPRVLYNLSVLPAAPCPHV